MQEIFLKNCRFFSRAVLFFGVLAALLFSCGEGIRLLPFPAFGTGQGENSNLENAEKSGYQKNVLRFNAGEGGGGSNSSKAKRGGQEFPAGDFAALGWLPVLRPNHRLMVYSKESAGIFESRFAALPLGSRAPPFS